MKPDVAVQVYDTTLRDGTQREGISLSVDDKLRIARRLDDLGVAFIEGGWPGSNPKDGEFFERARELPWARAALSAFGSTRRAGIAVEEDPGLRRLLSAGTKIVTVFGKTALSHVEGILRTTLEENLRMIEESIRFLRAGGVRVIYDAEHFFDGAREDSDYARETVAAAARGGAETVVLCDTNGGSLPWQVGEAVLGLKGLMEQGVRLGIHTHNDSECAVANALAAVRAGVRHIQGTINGYGERCGNANLCALIPNLELKLNLRCLPEGALVGLYDTAHFVAEVANLSMDEHMAYVGRSAFAHKGGVHVAAVRRSSASYQHVDPDAVGNRSRVVVSELAGKATVLEKADQFGLTLPAGVEEKVLTALKEEEARGYSFEAAEASVALRLRRESPLYRSPFRLLEYKLSAGFREEGGVFTEATVKLAVGNDVLHTVAEGDGPVSALDGALRKALTPVYPAIGKIQLVDYKVRILDGRKGTAATTRVLIDSSDGVRRWSTVGAAPSIIAASWQAMADGVEFGLTSVLDEGKAA